MGRNTEYFEEVFSEVRKKLGIENDEIILTGGEVGRIVLQLSEACHMSMFHKGEDTIDIRGYSWHTFKDICRRVYLRDRNYNLVPKETVVKKVLKKVSEIRESLRRARDVDCALRERDRKREEELKKRYGVGVVKGSRNQYNLIFRKATVTVACTEKGYEVHEILLNPRGTSYPLLEDIYPAIKEVMEKVN